MTAGSGEDHGMGWTPREVVEPQPAAAVRRANQAAGAGETAVELLADSPRGMAKVVGYAAFDGPHTIA